MYQHSNIRFLVGQVLLIMAQTTKKELSAKAEMNDLTFFRSHLNDILVEECSLYSNLKVFIKRKDFSKFTRNLDS